MATRSSLAVVLRELNAQDLDQPCVPSGVEVGVLRAHRGVVCHRGSRDPGVHDGHRAPLCAQSGAQAGELVADGLVDLERAAQLASRLERPQSPSPDVVIVGDEHAVPKLRERDHGDGDFLRELPELAPLLAGDED